jgi:hypothetical protein
MSYGDFMRLASQAGLSSVPIGATLRNGATRCRHSYLGGATTSANKQLYGRYLHVWHGDSVSAIRFKDANWYANNVGEYPGLGAMTITRAIEYPIGTNNLIQVTWGGRTSGTLPVPTGGGQEVVSDLMSLNQVLPRGAMFAERVFLSAPSGIIAATNCTMPGEFTYFAASGVSDLTMQVSQPAPVAANTVGYFPVAIEGWSSRPSVALCGDSRMAGTGDDPTQSVLGGIGEFGRALDAALPYLNMGCASDKLSSFIASHAYRAALANSSSFTHVHFNLGINDINSAVSASTMQGYIQTIAGYFPTKRVSWNTIAPNPTSTDGNKTEANSTANSNDAARVALNATLRTQPPPYGLATVFDTAAVLESSTKSGVFKATDTAPAGLYPGVLTADLLHESPAGYALLASSGAINPARFN